MKAQPGGVVRDVRGRTLGSVHRVSYRGGHGPEARWALRALWSGETVAFPASRPPLTPSH